MIWSTQRKQIIKWILKVLVRWLLNKISWDFNGYTTFQLWDQSAVIVFTPHMQDCDQPNVGCFSLDKHTSLSVCYCLVQVKCQDVCGLKCSVAFIWNWHFDTLSWNYARFHAFIAAQRENSTRCVLLVLYMQRAMTDTVGFNNVISLLAAEHYGLIQQW